MIFINSIPKKWSQIHQCELESSSFSLIKLKIVTEVNGSASDGDVRNAA